ncbi:hypothetical protein EG329_000552 [Mollisiaceae sp. DMI_Dod_QoI]|nr:hypothetical protein EG329_000552 [Helotiales sp. DMI_Dod_QoI]
MTESKVIKVAKPKHIPPPISLQDFRPGVLKPESYSLSEISSTLIAHLRRTEFTSTQMRGLARYQYQGSWNWGEPGNMVDVNKFFDIFNDIFFNGVLTGYCTLRTYQRELGSNYPYMAYSYILPRGRGRDTRYKRDQAAAFILFDVYNDHLHRPIPLVIHRIAVLLREMLHVLFSLFHCSCEHGCEAEANSRTRLGGYDLHWQAATYSLERAARREDLLGLHIYLDRVSQAAELLGQGKKTLWAQELSMGELESGFSVEIFRADVERVFKKFRSSQWTPKKSLKANVCIALWQDSEQWNM